jgi:hypothetical protein
VLEAGRNGMGSSGDDRKKRKVQVPRELQQLGRCTSEYRWSRKQRDQERAKDSEKRLGSMQRQKQAKTRGETKPAVREVDVERLHCNLTRSDRCAAEAGKAKVTESDSKFHWKQSVAVVSHRDQGGRVVSERFTLRAQQRPG